MVVEPTSMARPKALSWKPGHIAVRKLPPPVGRENTATVIFHSPWRSTF